MDELPKKKPGRPKKEGQTANKIVNVRPWTFYELNRLISPHEKTYDAVITKLIVFYKRNTSKKKIGDLSGVGEADNKNLSN